MRMGRCGGDQARPHSYLFPLPLYYGGISCPLSLALVSLRLEGYSCTMATRAVLKSLTDLFSFPHPVNEVAARMVAGMVVLLSVAIITLDLPWLLIVLAYGFLARVLTGPTLSSMGLLVTRVLVPLLGDPVRPVAGPPKRFAQGRGTGLLHYGAGAVLRVWTNPGGVRRAWCPAPVRHAGGSPWILRRVLRVRLPDAVGKRWSRLSEQRCPV